MARLCTKLRTFFDDFLKSGGCRDGGDEQEMQINRDGDVIVAADDVVFVERESNEEKNHSNGSTGRPRKAIRGDDVAKDSDANVPQVVECRRKGDLVRSLSHGRTGSQRSKESRGIGGGGGSVGRQIHNIYRKPLSRNGSNPNGNASRRVAGSGITSGSVATSSLRSLHGGPVKLWDSDPTDIHYYCAGSVCRVTHASRTSACRAGNHNDVITDRRGGIVSVDCTDDDVTITSDTYRRRVYTMPSNTGSTRRPPPGSRRGGPEGAPLFPQEKSVC